VKAGKWAWGYIFSRVVLGYLYDNPWLTDDIDAIIPMPAHIEAGQDPRRADHAGWVIQQAAEQDDLGLPFVYNPPLIIKTKATRKMRLTSGAAERRTVATEIYNALIIPDATKITGRRILVYDDVFTGGHTLDAVARRLRESGAAGVYGLALSRAQWRSQV
jgi:predicted amidophosphoribosyltransferase